MDTLHTFLTIRGFNSVSKNQNVPYTSCHIQVEQRCAMQYCNMMLKVYSIGLSHSSL